jgi:hypothetical protein
VLIEQLGLLSQALGCVEGVLEVIGAELARRERAGELAVTEGPFCGEAAQALTTMQLWAARASVSAAASQRAVDNAQIAGSGVAASR